MKVAVRANLRETQPSVSDILILFGIGGSRGQEMGFYYQEAKVFSQGKCGASVFGFGGEVILMVQKVKL
jgi:hypothetical protein